MIHHTCYKCGRRIDLDPVFVGMELSKLKVKKPKYYQAHCPACQIANKVSLSQMQSELDTVADEIAEKVAEMEKSKAEAKVAKKEAAVARREAAKAKAKSK